MDRYDLRARLEAATISWRYSAKPHGSSSAKAVHTRLLAGIGTPGRKGSQYQLSAADIRKVIVELREIALAHTKGASEALLALVEADCRFEYEQESMDGERHQASLRIDDIPYLDSVGTALSLINSFAELPQAQQAILARHMEEQKEVRHLEVRLQIERSEGTQVGQVQRTLKLAPVRAAFDRTLAQISPAGHRWLAQHRDRLNMLAWSDFALPILGGARFDAEQLLQASEALSQISDCLIMPFPLALGTDRSARRRWLKLWQACEDAAENLSMVSAWLRCLGSTGEYKRCRVCFRHVGEGMKKNCWLHHRSAKARVPSRELHVSDIYQETWKQIAEKHSDIRVLLDDVSPATEVKHLMQRAAEREELAPEVTIAAATLGALLHTLYPLFEPRIRDMTKRQFDACVQQANQLLRARRGLSADARETPPGRALRALSWERFFGDFFGSALSHAETTHFAAGKPIDIDHPLTSTTQTITVQKLALDLLHLSTWTSVDMAFDACSYLDVTAIRRDVLAAVRQSGRRPTYQALAEIHHATPQAIHRVLMPKSTGRRRYRVLEKGRTKLMRMMLKKPT